MRSRVRPSAQRSWSAWPNQSRGLRAENGHPQAIPRLPRTSFPPKGAIEVPECMIVSGVLAGFAVCYETGLGEVLPSCAARQAHLGHSAISAVRVANDLSGLSAATTSAGLVGSKRSRGVAAAWSLRQHGDPGARNVSDVTLLDRWKHLATMGTIKAGRLSSPAAVCQGELEG